MWIPWENDYFRWREDGPLEGPYSRESATTCGAPCVLLGLSKRRYFLLVVVHTRKTSWLHLYVCMWCDFSGRCYLLWKAAVKVCILQNRGIGSWLWSITCNLMCAWVGIFFLSSPFDRINESFLFCSSWLPLLKKIAWLDLLILFMYAAWEVLVLYCNQI